MNKYAALGIQNTTGEALQLDECGLFPGEFCEAIIAVFARQIWIAGAVFVLAERGDYKTAETTVANKTSLKFAEFRRIHQRSFCVILR